MSVRAVLARPRGGDPTQFEGVYLHNAGNPAELGPVLWTLMRDRYRFDPGGFSREMIDGNVAGWSNIDCLGGPLAKTWNGTTKISVEQHQKNFDEDREDAGPTSFQGDRRREIPGITSPPIDEASDNWDAELVYVVAPDGLRILLPEGSSGPYSLLALLPWGDEPDWDVVQETVNDAYEADDNDEATDRDYDYEHETAESKAAVSASLALVERHDVAGAQTKLLRYLAEGGTKTPWVLTNLFFTLSRTALPEPQLSRLLDDTLTTMGNDAVFLIRELVANVCIVLNNHGRGGDSLRLFELALANDRPLSAECYVGMTFGAYATQDPALMQRAVAHVERAMTERPRLLIEDTAVFDNTAALYVALGNKAKALEYVRLCKEHRYRNFADMPSMPDYASIKDDPDFVKLFR